VSKCHETTSAHSCMREVEVARTTLKRHKHPPPARFCVRGRWRRRRRRRNRKGPWHWPGAGITTCRTCVGFHMGVVSRWRRGEDSPYSHSEAPTRWDSPLVYQLPPTRMPARNPSTLKVIGLHPSMEGRGQVATSFGVVEPKKNKRGQHTYDKRVVNGLLTV
jgi:hypothetical protein